MAEALLVDNNPDNPTVTASGVLNKISVGAGSSSVHQRRRPGHHLGARPHPDRAVRSRASPTRAASPKFWQVNHAVSATAQRVAWTGSGDPPANATLLGQKTLSGMFQFQPWPLAAGRVDP